MPVAPYALVIFQFEYGYKKQMESFATKCLDQVKTAALAQDVSCDVLYVEYDHPYQAIIDRRPAPMEP
jgi:hypothetical protein